MLTIAARQTVRTSFWRKNGGKPPLMGNRRASSDGRVKQYAVSCCAETVLRRFHVQGAEWLGADRRWGASKRAGRRHIRGYEGYNRLMPGSSHDSIPPLARRDKHFATTRWSIVLAAGRTSSQRSRSALAELCECYWYPLYAFVRSQGYSAHDAHDATQEFFSRLLEKKYLAAVCPERGRFRAFLIAACKHFLSNERDRARAKKRGGGRQAVAWDVDDAEERYRLEPADRLTPERIFERQCAIALIERALDRLRTSYSQSGKERFFERMKGSLAGKQPDRPHERIAAELGMTPAAVKVAVHRLRKRFRELLREEIAQTVDDPADVDDELRELFAALAV